MLSPQAQWAAKQIGISENELVERNQSYFQKNFQFRRQSAPCDRQTVNLVTDEISKIRHENYEQRRRHKMRLLINFINQNQEQFNSQQISSPRQNEIKKAVNLQQIPTSPLRDPKQIQQELLKENQKLNKLVSTNENLRNIAKKDVQLQIKVQQRIQERQSKALAARQQLQKQKVTDLKAVNMQSHKHIKEHQRKIDRQHESMKNYYQNQSEIKSRMEAKQQRERYTSAKFYFENNKHLFMSQSVKNTNETINYERSPNQSFPLTSPPNVQIHNNSSIFQRRKASQNQLATKFSNFNFFSNRSQSVSQLSMRNITQSISPTKNTELEIGEALSKFDSKIQSAITRFQQRRNSVSAKFSQVSKQRESVNSQAKDIQDSKYMSAFKKMVDHETSSLESQKKFKQQSIIASKNRLQDKFQRLQLVSRRRSEIVTERCKILKTIVNRQHKKDESIIQLRDLMHQSSTMRREISILSQEKSRERRELDKRIDQIKKKRLMLKLVTCNDKQQDVKVQYQQLIKLRTETNNKRQELVFNRASNQTEIRNELLSEFENKASYGKNSQKN